MKTVKNCTLLLAVIFIACGCSYDLGKSTVTYTKATAKYGDLEAIRQTQLITTSQDKVNATAE